MSAWVTSLESVSKEKSRKRPGGVAQGASLAHARPLRSIKTEENNYTQDDENYVEQNVNILEKILTIFLRNCGCFLNSIHIISKLLMVKVY